MDKKTVVITGGSDGLGKAIAKKLASNWNVIIVSPSEEKLKNVAQELGVDYKVCDVSDYTQVEKCMESINSVDVLINSAGIWIEGDLVSNDTQKIKQVFDINTLGAIYMCRAAIPKLKEGTIINIISQAGLTAKPERGIYYASKWALTGFTKCLELDLAPLGTKVVGVYPSLMKTNMFAKAGSNKDTSKGLDVEEVAKSIEFILSLDNHAEITALEIKNI